MNPILEAEGLTKRYHGFSLKEILRSRFPPDRSRPFRPDRGGQNDPDEIAGPSNSAVSRTVCVLGLGYESAEKEIKGRFVTLPRSWFYKDRSVEITARFAADLTSRWTAAESPVPGRIHISPEKKIRFFVRGRKRCLALALALSHEAVLVLDEPTAGLDIVLRRAILERLRAFAAEGRDSSSSFSYYRRTRGDHRIRPFPRFGTGRCSMREKDESMTRWKAFKVGSLPIWSGRWRASAPSRSAIPAWPGLPPSGSAWLPESPLAT